MKDRNSKGRVPPPPPFRPARTDQTVDRRLPSPPSFGTEPLSGNPEQRSKPQVPETDTPQSSIPPLPPERRRRGNHWLDATDLRCDIPPNGTTEYYGRDSADSGHSRPLLSAMDLSGSGFRARRAPPMPKIPERASPSEYVRPLESPKADKSDTDASPLDSDDKYLDVPIVCARDNRAFVLQFRQKRGRPGTSYRLERTLTDIPGGSGGASSLTVPVKSIDFRDIKCPFCHSPCGPILCGACDRLGCKGTVKEYDTHQTFTCSCGEIGSVFHTLKFISASQASEASRSGGVAFCAPEAATSDVPRLPKPR